jgi:hypothetical protein
VRAVEQPRPPLVLGNRCLDPSELSLLSLTVVINFSKCDSLGETVELLPAAGECLR